MGENMNAGNLFPLGLPKVSLLFFAAVKLILKADELKKALFGRRRQNVEINSGGFFFPSPSLSIRASKSPRSLICELRNFCVRFSDISPPSK